MKKHLFILFLKYGVGLGLLAWVIWAHWHITVDGREVGLSTISERPFQIGFYALAFMIAGASVLLTFLRWYVLVRAQDMPFSVHSALRLGMVGYYFNTFLPGAVGGDLIKATCIAREQSRRTVAVATVLVDRMVGLCALVWLTALVGGAFWGLGLLPEIVAKPESVFVLEGITIGAAGLAAATLVFWFVLGLFSTFRAEAWAATLSRIPKIGGPLAELWRSVWLYRRRGRSVGLALLISLVSHTGFILVFYCASRSINPADSVPSFAAHLLITPVGNTIQAGIPTPGGVGGGEVAFEELYGAVLGRAYGEGVLASLTTRTVTWILGLLGYLVYLRMRATMQPPAQPGECPRRGY